MVSAQDDRHFRVPFSDDPGDLDGGGVLEGHGTQPDELGPERVQLVEDAPPHLLPACNEVQHPHLAIRKIPCDRTEACVWERHKTVKSAHSVRHADQQYFQYEFPRYSQPLFT